MLLYLLVYGKVNILVSLTFFISTLFVMLLGVVSVTRDLSMIGLLLSCVQPLLLVGLDVFQERQFRRTLLMFLQSFYVLSVVCSLEWNQR